MIGLIHTASVYTANGSTGAYTVLVATNLACRLALTAISEDASPDRAAHSGRRRLLWENYAMPEDAQVEIGGERWEVQQETVAPVAGLNGSTAYYRCEVTRV